MGTVRIKPQTLMHAMNVTAFCQTLLNELNPAFWIMSSSKLIYVGLTASAKEQL